MAKINVEFDSETKTIALRIDGQSFPVRNVAEVSLRRSGEEGQFDFAMGTTTDTVRGVETLETVKAAQDIADFFGLTDGQSGNAADADELY